MSHDVPNERRKFLGSSLTALGGLTLASCATGHNRDGDKGHEDRREHDLRRSQERQEPLVVPGSRVLFQGDSITDAGRSRKTQDAANDQPALGKGYAWLAAAGLLTSVPVDDSADDSKLEIFNRGISGHKVFQLAKRWQRDCLDLQPDVLSILIGVNDIWHSLGGKYDGTVEVYERDYDALLQRTRDALPKVHLVVCEPFVLRCGAVNDSWFPQFDEYRAAASRVATTHGATFVAFQSMFDRAVKVAPPKHWARDGVHPSAAGAALMAQHWLAAVQG